MVGVLSHFSARQSSPNCTWCLHRKSTLAKRLPNFPSFPFKPPSQTSSNVWCIILLRLAYIFSSRISWHGRRVCWQWYFRICTACYLVFVCCKLQNNNFLALYSLKVVILHYYGKTENWHCVRHSTIKIGCKSWDVFKVIIHNDDFTTMDFVVMILKTVSFQTEEAFHHADRSPFRQGGGGHLSYDVALSKVNKATSMAREQGFLYV